MSAVDEDDDVIRLDGFMDEDEAALQPGVPADDEHRRVDDEHQPHDDEAHPADAPFARLRAAYDRRLEVKRLVMEVPGWGGVLLVEFGLLSKREARRLRATTRGDRDDMTKVVADLLSAASKGLMEYDDDGEAKALEHEGRRLTFADAGLFTGLPVKTDRQGFLALFAEGPARQVNETALQAFANNVGRWMADTSLQVDGAVDLTVNDAGEVVSESVDSGS